MYNVTIYYSDGQSKEFCNINTIKYFTTELKTISNEQLLTMPIPVAKNIYLMSETSNISISCTNVAVVEVNKI